MVEPNDGRQEGVVKDGGNSRHTLVYKTQDEKVITPHTLQLHANANAWLVMQSYKISSSHSVHIQSMIVYFPTRLNCTPNVYALYFVCMFVYVKSIAYIDISVQQPLWPKIEDIADVQEDRNFLCLYEINNEAVFDCILHCIEV